MSKSELLNNVEKLLEELNKEKIFTKKPNNRIIPD